MEDTKNFYEFQKEKNIRGLVKSRIIENYVNTMEKISKYIKNNKIKEKHAYYFKPEVCKKSIDAILSFHDYSKHALELVKNNLLDKLVNSNKDEWIILAGGYKKINNPGLSFMHKLGEYLDIPVKNPFYSHYNINNLNDWGFDIEEVKIALKLFERKSKNIQIDLSDEEYAFFSDLWSNLKKKALTESNKMLLEELIEHKNKNVLVYANNFFRPILDGNFKNYNYKIPNDFKKGSDKLNSIKFDNFVYQPTNDSLVLAESYASKMNNPLLKTKSLLKLYKVCIDSDNQSFVYMAARCAKKIDDEKREQRAINKLKALGADGDIVTLSLGALMADDAKNLLEVLERMMSNPKDK